MDFLKAILELFIPICHHTLSKSKNSELNLGLVDLVKFFDEFVVIFRQTELDLVDSSPNRFCQKQV